MTNKISKLEQTAVETIAHMMLEEINNNNDNIREACLKAAMRLILSSNKKTENSLTDDVLSNNTISPLKALGDRDFLSKLISETQSNLTTIEESSYLKKEVNQLEKMIHALENKAETIDNSVMKKQESLNILNKHCDDAKRQAQETLNEIDYLTG